MQEDHGFAGANMEQDNRYVDTSDDDEIPDDSISIRNSPDKIDLVGKITAESLAPTDPF